MACDLSLLISTYDKEEGKMKQVPVSLGQQVDENEPVSIDRVVEAFAALSPDIRETIVAQLVTAKRQNITKTLLDQMVTVEGEKHPQHLVGNTTINDLLMTYPMLSQRYHINPENYSSYTIIRGTNITINNVSYNGRVLTNSGQEVFFIKDQFAAENFVKYLQAKEMAIEAFSDENTVPESVQPYLEDLKIIAKRKSLGLVDTVIHYLNDRDSFSPFVHQGQPITPRLVLGNIVAALTGEYNADQAKTDLELVVSSLKVKQAGYDWKLPKGELYDMLVTYFPEFGQQFSKDNFRSMSVEELSTLFFGPNGMFVGHPTLGRAKIASATQGTRKVEQPDTPTTTKTGRLPKTIIKGAWNTVRAQAEEAGITLPEKYSEYEKLDPETMSKIFNQAGFTYKTEEGGPDRLITTRVVTDKNGTKRVEYNYEYTVQNEPKIKETASYITLTFPYSLMGEIYNFGYNTQSLFSPVTEGPVVGGKYNGMFVYKAVIPTAHGTRDVYAISRSIISPYSYMKTFPTLEAAVHGVNDKVQSDKIGTDGLITIKQQSGLPREVAIEMNNVQEGQILSTLDIQLPKVQLKTLPNSLKQLFDLTVPDFIRHLQGVDGIEKLNTPEKAAAFILKASQLFDRNEMKLLTASKTIEGALELLASPQYSEQVTGIINEIDSAPMKHYYVEKLVITKETKNRARTKIATLKYLNNGGTDINLEGTFVGDMTVDEFIGQTMDQAIDFFNQTYGVEVVSMTSPELEQFSIDNNLGIEQNVAGIKAFIYNGQIYINTTNAKSSDLFHEVSHIFLGVLKAQYPAGYQQVIDAYTKRDAFKRKLNYITRSYKNFALQDKVEEAVVDMIADEMMRDSKLSSLGFNQDRFTEMMMNIMNTVDSFKQNMQDSGLGFNGFIKDLLTKNSDKLKRQRALTEFVHRAIANKQISEVDC